MLNSLIKRFVNRFGYDINRLFPRDLSDDEARIIHSVYPYTMTSPDRLLGVIRAVEHLVRHNIAGDIMECGVWRGGSMMAMALTLIMLRIQDRQLYLFDTFEGMPQPTEKDDKSAWTGFRLNRGNGNRSDWLKVPEHEVKANMESTGYPSGNIHIVKGMVEDTIPAYAPRQIALLRLDTDWYTSTKHELIHLYPRLVTSGFLILDDYGHWSGARKAVDEYIEENQLTIFLNRLDYTGRLIIKNS